jgi:hypothetical protein
MKKTLTQRNLLSKHFYELSPDGLQITEKGVSKSRDYFITYEDIGTKVIKFNKGKKGWLIAALIFLVLTGLLYFLQQNGGNTDKDGYLVYAALTIICAIVYLSTYTRAFLLVTIDDSNPISFLTNNPSESELNEFIQLLKNERKKYLLEKYGTLSKLISYEQQFNTLNWLNRNEVLTKDEYSAKIEELNSLFPASNVITGFGVK